MTTILDGDYNKQRFKFFADCMKDMDIVDILREKLVIFCHDHKLDASITIDERIVVVETDRMRDLYIITDYFALEYGIYTDRALN